MLILGSGQDYFSLFNTWLPVFICIVIVVALLKTAVSVRNLLKKSPGDLIYERENNASAGYSPVNTYPDPL